VRSVQYAIRTILHNTRMPLEPVRVIYRLDSATADAPLASGRPSLDYVCDHHDNFGLTFPIR